MPTIKTTVHVCGIDVEVEAEYTVSDETDVGLGPRYIEVDSVTIIDKAAAIDEYSQYHDDKPLPSDSEIEDEIVEAACEAVIEKIEEQER